MLSPKSRLLTTLLISSLGLSACGKKKDLYSPPPEQVAQAEKDRVKAEQKNAPQEKGKGMPQLPLKDQKPNLGGGFQPPGEAPAEQDPNSPRSHVPVVVPEGEDVGELPSIDETEEAPTVPPSAPPVAPQEGELPPQGQVPSQPTRVSLRAGATGGVNPNGLLYSSLAQDDVLAFLRARNEKVDDVSRQKNLTAAASVVSAELQKKSNGHEAVLTITMIENGMNQTYVLKGALAPGKAAALSRVGGEGQTTVAGTLKCLDADGGCESTFARLRVGTPGEAAIVNVIFRDLEADAMFRFSGKKPGNRLYTAWQAFAYNSQNNLHSSNKVQTIQASSWEVVNGRAGFDVDIYGVNKQLITFAGPLVFPRQGDQLNERLFRSQKSKEGSYASDYARSIVDARLVLNNGRGLLVTDLMVGDGASAPARMQIQFKAKAKSLVPLTDENLK